MNARFDAMDARFDAMDARFVAIGNEIARSRNSSIKEPTDAVAPIRNVDGLLPPGWFSGNKAALNDAMVPQLTALLGFYGIDVAGGGAQIQRRKAQTLARHIGIRNL
jgi:hypothetical protein